MLNYCAKNRRISSSRTLYLGLSSDFLNKDQGVQVWSASSPSSQKIFNSAGLNPDIIDAFFCKDKVGNPDVERKFQKRM